MKFETQNTALKHFVSHQKGFAFKSKEYQEVGHPIVRVSNFSIDSIDVSDCNYIDANNVHLYKEVELKTNDIVIATVGSWATNPSSVVGKVIRVPVQADGALLNQNAVRLRAKKGLAQDYLYYLLKTQDFKNYIIGTARGSASQASITLDAIFGFEFDLPSLNTQEKIVEILRSIDDKLELNNRINETLEQLAQTIFKSWFVDFDPVRAKVEALEKGESPELAAMQAISGKSLNELAAMPADKVEQLTATAALFPSEFEDSELGEIPKGWDKQKLEDIITLHYGKALRAKDRIEGDIPVYGSGGITGTHNKSIVEGPGIIVGRKGTIGKIYWENGDFYPIDTVFYVESRSDTSLDFIFYLLQTLGLDKMNTDAAVPGLNRNNAYRLEIPKYPQPLTSAFTRLVSTFRQNHKKLNLENATLINFRDSLLPKLLSGELSISAAEEFVEGV